MSRDEAEKGTIPQLPHSAAFSIALFVLHLLPWVFPASPTPLTIMWQLLPDDDRH